MGSDLLWYAQSRDSACVWLSMGAVQDFVTECAILAASLFIAKSNTTRTALQACLKSDVSAQ